MKLKKIASLALAGAMAVSMLAGCSGKTTGEGNGEEQNQVTAASVADYANSLLSEKQKNVFTFENSSELTAALQKVAGDSTKVTSEIIGNFKDEFAANITVDSVVDELQKELELDFVAKDGNSAKSLAGTNEKGTKTLGFAYGVSGKLAEDAAVQLVINDWQNKMNGYDCFPAISVAYDFDYDYTAEISAVKVTAPDDSTVSAWVVAIVVTQTATEVVNA